MQKMLITALLLVISPSAFAAEIVQATQGTEEIEGVKLSTTADVTIGKEKTTLTRIAAGMRRKKVALFWVKVSVVQVFASDSKKIAPGTPVPVVHQELSSKNSMVSVALNLKRDLTPNQIKDAFQDSLKHNDVDPTSEALKPVMDTIAKLPAQKEGTTIWLVLKRNPDGSEAVYFQDGAGEVHTVTAEKGIMKNLLLIWFGKPADSGMERLQEQLVPPAA